MNVLAGARLRVIVNSPGGRVVLVDEGVVMDAGEMEEGKASDSQISIFHSTALSRESFSPGDYRDSAGEDNSHPCSEVSVFPSGKAWKLRWQRRGRSFLFIRRCDDISIHLKLNFMNEISNLNGRVRRISTFLPLLERMVDDIPVKSAPQAGGLKNSSIEGYGEKSIGDNGLRKSRTEQEYRMDPPFIGCSPGIRHIKRYLPRISGSDLPVLIEGESGTGKEIIARNIHRISERSRRPCVIVNCMEIPSSLLQGEIFGHSRGAFTGASRDRAGLVERAAGGTMFIDEIGELPTSSQAALLRVLQEGEVRRIGESSRRKVDVRFIFATNRKLSRLVDQGDFRKDLYFRVRGVHIEIPPLRKRRDDIIPLAEYFLTETAGEAGIQGPSLSMDAAGKLVKYHWPGNVRELKNEIKCLLLFNPETPVINAEMLPPHISTPSSGSGNNHQGNLSLSGAIEDLERRMIAEALMRFQGNRTRAARELQISRQGLLKKLKRLGMAEDYPS